MSTFNGYLMGMMKNALKDVLFDEVLGYFQERVSSLSNKLEKHIEAGDVIAEDEERAKIIIEAVAVVLARRIERKMRKAVNAKTVAPPKVQPGEALPRFRGVLAQTTYQCIQKIEGEFTTREIIERMRSDGNHLSSNADVSVNEVLKKFLKHGWVEVTEQGAGRRPTFYRRARKFKTASKKDQASAV